MKIVADAFDLVADGARNAFDDAGRYLLALVQALLVLLAARLVLGYLRRQLSRALTRTDSTPYAQSVVQQILSVSVYFLALSLVLAAFGASWSGVLTFLAVTSVAIALSIQDVLKNLIAGVYILIERPFALGETIRLKDHEGQAERVSLRTTRLRTEADDQVIVPNATLLSEVVVVPAAHGPARLSVLLTGITAPLPEIGPAIEETLAEASILRSPSPRTSIRRVGATGADVAVTIWHDPDDAVAPRLLARLRQRFPESELIVEEA